MSKQPCLSCFTTHEGNDGSDLGAGLARFEEVERSLEDANGGYAEDSALAVVAGVHGDGHFARLVGAAQAGRLASLVGPPILEVALRSHRLHLLIRWWAG